eukprot:14402345-Alexandrium_andersonii.AAC.1
MSRSGNLQSASSPPWQKRITSTAACPWREWPSPRQKIATQRRCAAFVARRGAWGTLPGADFIASIAAAGS